MAHYTTNLNLYEKDPATDGADTFNISTMMNDNWDKIDTSTGKLSNLTTQAKSSLVAAINETNEKSGMPIGTIYSVNCSSSYVPDGALPCDGTEYTKAQFTDLWTNYLNTVSPATEPLLKTCTYADYQTAITTYGQCPMFAVDSVNNKFKVPTIKDGAYITQALSNSELGKSYKESLPNITGGFGADDRTIAYTSGAFYVGTEYYPTGSEGAENCVPILFDASRSSSTYQNNAKVQGDNVRLRYFVQVASGQINQSIMDWSAWASSLAGKLNADGTNLGTGSGTGTVRAVVEVSDRSILPRWYRVYSDGWCEQGGTITFNATRSYVTSVTLLKTFNDTNYIINATTGTNLTSELTYLITAEYRLKQTNSFSLQCSEYSNNSVCISMSWEASGYLASGQW